LGAVYADLFGSKIRAMVLAGAVDPSQQPLPGALAQATSFDSVFHSFVAACQESPSCPWKPPAGGNLVAAFRALVAQVGQHPLAVGARTVGPAEVLTGTAAGLYDTSSWPVIYQALANAQRGDGTLILRAFDSYNELETDPNLQQANAAVNCLEGPRLSAAAVAAQAPSFAAAAPVFGTSVLDQALGCSLWPVPPTSTPHVIKAPQSPPIVVVGSTGDPLHPGPASRRPTGPRRASDPSR